MKSVPIRRFFWAAFYRIRSEYEDLRSKYPYLVRIRENTDLKKLRIWTFITKCTSLQLMLSNLIKRKQRTGMYLLERRVKFMATFIEFASYADYNTVCIVK